MRAENLSNIDVMALLIAQRDDSGIVYSVGNSVRIPIATIRRLVGIGLLTNYCVETSVGRGRFGHSMRGKERRQVVAYAKITAAGVAALGGKTLGWDNVIR